MSDLSLQLGAVRGAKLPRSHVRGGARKLRQPHRMAGGQPQDPVCSQGRQLLLGGAQKAEKADGTNDTLAASFLYCLIQMPEIKHIYHMIIVCKLVVILNFFTQQAARTHITLENY